MTTSPKKDWHTRFRHRRIGVFDLVYEDNGPLAARISSLLHGFGTLRDEIPYGKRHIADAIKLAPVAFVAYLVTTIWISIYPAINLYWMSVLLDKLREGITNEVFLPDVYRTIALSWISCAVVNEAVGRACVSSRETLTQRFRAYFIPQLIRASMRVDLLTIQDLYSIFPVAGRLEYETPGIYFLSQLGHVQESPEREVFLSICVVRGLLRWLAPSIGIGGSAYIYWSNNSHFQRMKMLFSLAFSTQYRTDLMLDGMASSIETEYDKSVERLGDVKIWDPQDSWSIRQPWYWKVLVDITLDLSMAVYALVLTRVSPSSIASMILLQRVTRCISLNGDQCGEGTSSLLSACTEAKRLYNAIDHQSTMLQGTEPYPRQADTSKAGMHIAFRHVSLRYPGSDRHALLDTSFEIQPGELVLVVGTNGSGKSSLLKLLSRLFDPTAGEIVVDGLPLTRYDAAQVRAAVAFQSQSPVVYPVSVRENIAFGLPRTVVCDKGVDVAARMGGCTEWITRLRDGYETQLQPSFDIHNGWLDGMHGCLSDALKEVLARHKGPVVSISGGEKQRLAAARTFMRIHHRAATRLVAVDEGTSALDPAAEHAILSALRSVRAGKTMILVTHRFYHLAHVADRILCLQDGRVVGNGTHAALLRANGEYAALYRAQVASAG